MKVQKVKKQKFKLCLALFEDYMGVASGQYKQEMNASVKGLVFRYGTEEGLGLGNS